MDKEVFWVSVATTIMTIVVILTLWFIGSSIYTLGYSQGKWDGITESFDRYQKVFSESNKDFPDAG